LNHEGHEEHEVDQCAIDDRTVTFRVNPMTAAGFNGTWIFFVFLRVLRGGLLFLGSSFSPAVIGPHSGPYSTAVLCRVRCADQRPLRGKAAGVMTKTVGNPGDRR
jgi:hypothetical protein